MSYSHREPSRECAHPYLAAIILTGAAVIFSGLTCDYHQLTKQKEEIQYPQEFQPVKIDKTKVPENSKQGVVLRDLEKQVS